MLAVGRCIQGLSVSILFFVWLAHLIDTVGRNEVGQWIGFVLSGMNIGVMVLPFLRGLVYDKARYYLVFFLCLGVIVFVFLLRVSIVKRKAAAKYGKEPLTADKANNSPSDKHDVESHTGSPFLVVSSGDGKTRPKLKTNSTESIGAEASERDPLILTNHTRDRNPRNEPQNGRWVFSKGLIVTKTLFKSTQIVTSCLGIFILITVLNVFDAVLPSYVNKNFGRHSTGAGLIFFAITIPEQWWGTHLTDLAPKSIGQIILLCAIFACTGLGLNVLLAPLASDMSFAIEDLNEKNPGLFQSAGVYAQVYSMFNSGLAAGMMAGPPIASLIYSKTQLGNHEFGPSRHMRARHGASKTSKSSASLWKQPTPCQILFTGRPCR